LIERGIQNIMEGQLASSEAGLEDVSEQTMMASGEQSIRERQTATSQWWGRG
jgi:hypothetical protein